MNVIHSIKCGHCYEKGAILRYLDKKKNMNCPVAGCKGTVTRNDLVEDSDMLWEVVGNILDLKCSGGRSKVDLGCSIVVLICLNLFFPFCFFVCTNFLNYFS